MTTTNEFLNYIFYNWSIDVAHEYIDVPMNGMVHKVLGRHGTKQSIKADINPNGLGKMVEIYTNYCKEQELINSNVTVKDAWEKYQTVRALCKDYNK